MLWPVIMLKLCIKGWNEIFVCLKIFIVLELITESWNFQFKTETSEIMKWSYGYT